MPCATYATTTLFNVPKSNWELRSVMTNEADTIENYIGLDFTLLEKRVIESPSERSALQ